MKCFWNPLQQFHTPRFFLQRGQLRDHFEVPARAETLLAACDAMGMEIMLPPEADHAPIEAVHAQDYLSFLRNAPGLWRDLPDHGPELVPNFHPCPEMLANGGQRGDGVLAQLGWYTMDTSCPITEHTWQAAESAAAGAIAAATVAATGQSAYALARPPGHHAYRARAAGHCYLNNAAIAAEKLRHLGAERVAILDIDSHHGNGTQDIFWRCGDVLVVSMHGDPNRYYPWYVGHADECGEGEGFDKNINLPLALGSGDDVWLGALQTGLQAIRQFAPDAMVLSLGFDASEHEPLAALRVTEDGFSHAGNMIGALKLPTAIVQEGGYNLDLIGTLLTRFLTGWHERSV